jgi:hypothetical protein
LDQEVHREKSAKQSLSSWYHSSRLITVQIDLLIGCSARFAMTAVGYVAALLFDKIEKAFIHSKVGSSIKV